MMEGYSRKGVEVKVITLELWANVGILYYYYERESGISTKMGLHPSFNFVKSQKGNSQIYVSFNYLFFIKKLDREKAT